MDTIYTRDGGWDKGPDVGDTDRYFEPEGGEAIMRLPHAEISIFEGWGSDLIYRYVVLVEGIPASAELREKHGPAFSEFIYCRTFADLVKLLQELRQAFDWHTPPSDPAQA